MPVRYWNDVANESLRLDFSRSDATGMPLPPEQPGPAFSSRAMALVHLAMYDAFVAQPGSTAPYTNVARPAGGPANSAAALGAAAHYVLRSLYRAQRGLIDERAASFAASLSGGGTVTAGSEQQFGRAVAQALLADRAQDPGPDNEGGYIPSPERGRHRPDPLHPTQGFHGVMHPLAKTWAVCTRYSIDPPPLADYADPEYKAAYDDVYLRGGAPDQNSHQRTPDQTVAGVFWAYDGARQLGTPPRLYNQIVREVSQAHGLTAIQDAQLFALVNVAMGDAGILAWQEKYFHDYWRPVLGIREGHASLGPQGSGGRIPAPGAGGVPQADTEWRPYGAPASNNDAAGPFTPNFPAYPSGHATFGAAALQIARRFLHEVAGAGPAFGTCDADAFAFDFVSDEYNGATYDPRGSRDLRASRGAARPRHVRRFDSIWQAIIENSASRVYLGVHWRFDGYASASDAAAEKPPDLTKNVGGVPLGLNIANDILDRFVSAGNVLQPPGAGCDRYNRATGVQAPCKATGGGSGGRARGAGGGGRGKQKGGGGSERRR